MSNREFHEIAVSSRYLRLNRSPDVSRCRLIAVNSRDLMYPALVVARSPRAFAQTRCMVYRDLSFEHRHSRSVSGRESSGFKSRNHWSREARHWIPAQKRCGNDVHQVRAIQFCLAFLKNYLGNSPSRPCYPRRSKISTLFRKNWGTSVESMTRSGQTVAQTSCDADPPPFDGRGQGRVTKRS